MRIIHSWDPIPLLYHRNHSSILTLQIFLLEMMLAFHFNSDCVFVFFLFVFFSPVTICTLFQFDLMKLYSRLFSGYFKKKTLQIFLFLTELWHLDILYTWPNKYWIQYVLDTLLRGVVNYFDIFNWLIQSPIRHGSGSDTTWFGLRYSWVQPVADLGPAPWVQPLVRLGAASGGSRGLGAPWVRPLIRLGAVKLKKKLEN
jgi:hypothetical protein